MRTPWDRQPGETPLAYGAFNTFRDLGRRRTIVEAYRQAKGKFSAAQADGTWNGWSSKHSWMERAADWDEHLRMELDKIAVREARIWEVRRRRALRESFALAQRLKQRAGEMLAMPLTKKSISTEDGRVVQVHPARWSMSTAILAAKVAVELEHAIFEAAEKSLDQCSSAELEAIRDAALESLDGEPPG